MSLLLDNNGIDLQVDGVTGFDAQMSGGAEISNEDIGYFSHGNSSFLWTYSELDQDNASAIEIVSDVVSVNSNSFAKRIWNKYQSTTWIP